MSENDSEYDFYSGRPPIKSKASWWKRLFCRHIERDGSPFYQSKIYPDIQAYQCEDCGQWFTPQRLARSPEFRKYTKDLRRFVMWGDR